MKHAAIWIAFALSCPGVRAFASDAPNVWQSLKLSDVRALMAETGGKIEEVKRTPEGGYSLEAVYPGNLPVNWEGMQCKGEGDATACTEYNIEIAIEVESVDRAKAIDEDRMIYFPADGHVGNRYLVWRMGFTYGGVTRAYIKNVLTVTIDMARDAVGEIWPKPIANPEAEPARG